MDFEYVTITNKLYDKLCLKILDDLSVLPKGLHISTVTLTCKFDTTVDCVGVWK